MAFELRFGFILSCFGGREVKNEHGFFALTGENRGNDSTFVTKCTHTGAPTQGIWGMGGAFWVHSCPMGGGPMGQLPPCFDPDPIKWFREIPCGCTLGEGAPTRGCTSV